VSLLAAVSGIPAHIARPRDERQTQPDSQESAAGAPDSARKSAFLTRVTDVRQLSPERAAKSVPVRLRGVVTDLPGFKNSFFLQDSTDAIGVDRTDTADVRVGDVVELTGTSTAGLFLPSVMADYVKVVGHGGAPPARRVSYDNLVGGAQDSEWIEVHGIVRSARMGVAFGRAKPILILGLGGGSMRVILQDFAGFDYARLIDSTVRLRGLCATNFNAKRQFVGVELYVPDRRYLQVEHAAAEDPFAAPAIEIREAFQFGKGQHRIKIAGIATYQIPGHAIYLQDGSDGIEVQSSQTEAVATGSRIEAVGFPAMGDYAPVLEDGLVRVVGAGKPIDPVRIEAKDAIVAQRNDDDDLLTYAPYDEQLVELQGKVMEVQVQGDRRVWFLRHDSEVFEVSLPITVSNQRIAAIAPGSLLSVTGICKARTDSERTPISFGVQVRTPKDIVVLRSPPWWTPAHSLLVFAGLAGMMVIALLWVVLLRIRVEQQTRTIRDSEARFQYLAEHDELTGLLNRRAILATMNREMARAFRERSEVTIVLGDIDHFKRVNDCYGHLAGDAALRRFASALVEWVRPYDCAGRYGGEEFLIVLSGVPAGKVRDRLAELHSRISNLTVRDAEREFEFTCSLGAVQIDGGCGEHVENAGEGSAEYNREAVLTAADLALYEAKDTGRNRVVLRRLQVEGAVPRVRQRSMADMDGLRKL
jgi:diguanylate cyclase (GGDEF)-like protein